MGTAILSIGRHPVLLDRHDEVVDVPVGVDPGEGVEGADDRPHAERPADDFPLEFLDQDAQPASLESGPDARELGVEPEVGRVPEGRLLVEDTDESVAESGQVLPVGGEAAAGVLGEGPDEQAGPLGQEVLAHQVARPGQVVVGESPDVVPDLFVLGVVGGLVRVLDPEEETPASDGDDLLEFLHVRWLPILAQGRDPFNERPKAARPAAGSRAEIEIEGRVWYKVDKRFGEWKR